MEEKFKKQEGITLIALTIIVILLIILAGIGIGSVGGINGNIKNSKNTIAMSQLNKIQQLVLETNIKYKQTKNERLLKGKALEYNKAQEKFNDLKSTEQLKATTYDLESDDPGNFYYELKKWHLEEMGLENITEDDEYIVNYSTGEVFNITHPKTATGEIQYIYLKK